MMKLAEADRLRMMSVESRSVLENMRGNVFLVHEVADTLRVLQSSTDGDILRITEQTEIASENLKSSFLKLEETVSRFGADIAKAEDKILGIRSLERTSSLMLLALLVASRNRLVTLSTVHFLLICFAIIY